MIHNKTIREMVGDYQGEILKGNLVPGRAAEILTALSSLVGNLNSEILNRDVEYNKVLLKCYNEEKSANRAKIVSSITPEYEAMRTARNTKDLAMEIIRSLKYFLRNSEDEFREASKFQ
jgi:hypothetical protein